jgi:hypothetical protein
MKMTTTLTTLTATALLAGGAQALSFDADVTPDVIFGTGNANGGWTIDSMHGVELGLRAKLRHNAAGLPENTFNSNGDGTYTFDPIVGPTQSFPTAEWSFEWSINTDANGTGDRQLNDLTYELGMTSPNTDAETPIFDPINVAYADHAIGDNSTGNGDGIDAGDATAYSSLISGGNVAQNSWKPHWFVATGDFDPTIPNAEYIYTLSAFDNGVQIASTSITVITTPSPTAALAGALGLGFVVSRRRRGTRA